MVRSDRYRPRLADHLTRRTFASSHSPLVHSSYTSGTVRYGNGQGHRFRKVLRKQCGLTRLRRSISAPPSLLR